MTARDPVLRAAAKARASARSRAFVAEINARTVCAHCGAQPIEWHNPEHVELRRQLYRIGTMARAGRSIAAIQAEMDRCTPLCRRCHMQEDGRMAVFLEHARKPKGQPPKPCADCSQSAKPLRRGRCARCDWAWRVAQNPELLERRRLSDRRRYYTKTPNGENLGAVLRRDSLNRRKQSEVAS